MNFRTAITQNDLQKILDLQVVNLKQNLTKTEIESQGFLTCQHNFEQLEAMNRVEAHLLMEQDDELAGYLLAMTRAAEKLLPMLEPMYKRFSELSFKEKPLNSYNYLIVGQVCIAKKFRGLQLLDKAYNAYRNLYAKKYDFTITEVAADNPRSINAHKRIGFEVIDTYREAEGKQWAVILWDWTGNSEI